MLIYLKILFEIDPGGNVFCGSLVINLFGRRRMTFENFCATLEKLIFSEYKFT